MTTLLDPVRPATSLTEADIQHYSQEGYVHLRGLITPEEAATCRHEIMHIMDTIGLSPTKLKQTNQYLHGSHMDALINSPSLQAIASALMAGPAHLYLPFSAVKTAKGGGNFDFHQDNQYTRHDGPSNNMWFALNDMCEDNGTLFVQPRSHLNGTLPSEQVGDGHRKVQTIPNNAIPMTMKAGDCIAFTRLTVHGSGANITDEHRVAYAVQFHREDTKAYYNDAWHLMKDNPRWAHIGPVDSIK